MQRHIVPRNQRTMSVTGSNIPHQAIGVESEKKDREMSQARAKAQMRYNEEATIHKQKAKDKEQKKRLEKLERYKGVGELGNELSGNKLSENRKRLEMEVIRAAQQSKYACNAEDGVFKLIQQQELASERELKKRLEKLERYKGVGELGNELSDNKLSENRKSFEMEVVRTAQQSNYACDAEDGVFKLIQQQELLSETDQLKNLSINQNMNEANDPMMTINAYEESCTANSNLKIDTQAANTIPVTRSHLSHETAVFSGNRLGGERVYEQGKGEHPLLAKLNKSKFTKE